MKLKWRSPLHVAVVEERTEAVTELLNRGSDKNAKDVNEMTPLHLAIETRNLSIIKLLLDAGADVFINSENPCRPTPLQMAVRSNNSSILRLFIEAVGGVNARNIHYKSILLHLAVSWGNSNFVKHLIDAGADLTAKDRFGDTPLHKAWRSTNIEVFKTLIDAGVNLNEKGYEENTILHFMAGSDDLRIMKLLVDAGADVNVKNKIGSSPVHIAADYGNLEGFKFLIDSGADVNAKTHLGFTVLHGACRAKNLKMIKQLIDCGADVDASDNSNQLYSLLMAVASKNLDIAILLIDAGSDINVRNEKGLTPLRVAVTLLDLDMLKLLVLSGANVNDDVHENDIASLEVFINRFLKKDGKDENLVTTGTKLLIDCMDVNLKNKRGILVLKDILESSGLEPVRKYFYQHVLKHVAIVEALNNPLDENLLKTITTKELYRVYFRTCRQELKKAKSTRLRHCWVTFFNLLVDGKFKLVKYAGNADLIKDFSKSVNKFPIYGSDMQINVSEGIADRESRDGAANILSYYLPILNPTHLIIKDILDFLGKRDWEKLSERKRFREE